MYKLTHTIVVHVIRHQKFNFQIIIPCLYTDAYSYGRTLAFEKQKLFIGKVNVLNSKTMSKINNFTCTTIAHVIKANFIDC